MPFPAIWALNYELQFDFNSPRNLRRQKEIAADNAAED
jgi:hypothetical protein